MAISKRQRLVDAIVARFETVLTTGGYRTDAGQLVETFRSNPFTTDEMPAISVREGLEQYGKTGPDNQGQSVAGGGFFRRLPFTVDLVIAEGEADPVLARAALADAEEAIGKDSRWGGLAIRTVPRGAAIVTDERGNWIGGARLEFEVHYTTDEWSPDE